MLYVHGLASVRRGAKSDAFAALAAAVGACFCRVDLRGHGESGGSLLDATLSGFVADAAVGAATMRQSSEQLVAVGASIGGLAAALLHAQHHYQLSALVMISCGAGFVDRMRKRHADSGNVDTVVIPSRYVDSGRIVVGRALLDDAASLVADEEWLAKSITCPVLMVHGECDDVAPLEEARRFFALLPPNDANELVVLPGEDHRMSGSLAAITGHVARFLHAHAGWPRHAQ